MAENIFPMNVIINLGALHLQALILPEMAAANQQEMVILHHLQELILSGTRCFESDDVDCHGILIDLRQGLRSLSVLNLQPNNFNSIQDTLKALIDQLEMRIQIRREQATTDCFKAPRSNPLGKMYRGTCDHFI